MYGLVVTVSQSVLVGEKKGNEKGVGISPWTCEFLPSIETRGKTLALYLFCSSFTGMKMVSVGEE